MTRKTQRLRTIACTSPRKSEFICQVDNDVCAVNVQVALCKEDYGEPGSSEHQKNMAAATHPLAEKFGVARHKVLSLAEDGDEKNSCFVQQVLVGLTHPVKEGHEHAKKQEISETRARAWQLSVNRRFSEEDLTATASLWLKEFIYNSCTCTDSLRTAIEKKFDKILLEQQGCVTYLWYCLDEMFTMSREWSKRPGKGPLQAGSVLIRSVYVVCIDSDVKVEPDVDY
eukprot:scaffold7863_cov37-Cyclotella_meneghiniana.AAC.13